MRHPPDKLNGSPPEPPFADPAAAKQLLSAFSVQPDGDVADDPAAPDYSRGDLGPLRGSRRRKPTAFGRPSTFGLNSEALRAERRRRMVEGWAEWEITARFADPDAAGAAGMPRRVRARRAMAPGCQECAA